MGYPIKVLNSHFEQMDHLRDIQINTGGLLGSWNIFSHFGYWRSRKLVRRLASYLALLLTMDLEEAPDESV